MVRKVEAMVDEVAEGLSDQQASLQCRPPCCALFLVASWQRPCWAAPLCSAGASARRVEAAMGGVGAERPEQRQACTAAGGCSWAILLGGPLALGCTGPGGALRRAGERSA